jgi:UDP:flavonoid glycosyltransferase YjiC (YdhE family)
MAHFAILCPEYAGHLLPIGSVGVELVRRGHRVTVVSREQAAPLVEKLGLSFHEMKTEGIPQPSALFQWLAFRIFGAQWVISLRCYFQFLSEAILRLAPKAFADLQADGVLVDETLPVGGTAAQRAGIPFVTLSSGFSWNEEPSVPPFFTPWSYAETRLSLLRNRCGYAGWHWFMKPSLQIINRYRRMWGLPLLRHIDDSVSPLAQISQLCPGFDFPRRDLPGSFHYIGSMAANRCEDPDARFPWDWLDHRPLIFASLGTIDDPKNLPILPTIMDACCGLPVQLVLALGKWSEKQSSLREKLGPPPDNALVVDFAPQLALLDRASLLITHAGANTVLEAICRAVPMVALPRSGDQPGMGSRIEHAGIGLRASFGRCTSANLRRLIERVLAGETFRQRSRAVQQAMVAAGGVQRAAEIAEEALTARRPVFRTQPCNDRAG